MLTTKTLVIAVVALSAAGAAGFAGTRMILTRGSGGLGSECRSFSTEKEEACFRRLFAERLAKYGVADAIATLNALSATDAGVARHAHEYAHGIGIDAYSRYPDIVSSFTECGDGASSGCRHGIIQAYFEARDRGTAPDVEGFCRPFKQAGMSRWILFQCVHGMGHGLTMFYEHDLPRALSDCDRLASGWDRESCYGGAFMESDMNAIKPHHPASELAAQSHHQHAAFKAIDPEDPLYPCTAVAERYWRACYEIQTAVVLHLNRGNIGKTARTCDTAPASMRDACYQSLGRDITSYALRSPKKSAGYCAKGSEAHRPACYVGVAKALVDWTATTDNALEFCRLITSDGPAGAAACYQAVGEQIATLSNDPTRRAAECARISEADGLAACRRGAQLP